MIDKLIITKKISKEEGELVNSIIGIVQYIDPDAKIDIHSNGHNELNYNVKPSDPKHKEVIVQDLLTFVRSKGKKIIYSKSLQATPNIFFNIVDK